MKNKNTIWIAVVLAIVLAATVILCVAINSTGKDGEDESSLEVNSEYSSEASAPTISVPDDFDESTYNSNDDVSPDGNGITAETSTASDISKDDDTSKPSGNKADTPAKPEKPANDTSDVDVSLPDDTSNGETPPANVYSCGYESHNCENEDYHKGLVAREEAGCPYCGSHECISFYAVDEWGYTIYDATLCPKYDAHTDPYKYCQICGKKVGDGRNGTCAVFVVDTDCPYCKEHVRAWECHTCK